MYNTFPNQVNVFTTFLIDYRPEATSAYFPLSHSQLMYLISVSESGVFYEISRTRLCSLYILTPGAE